jgi:HK97 gp10 family phage protein
MSFTTDIVGMKETIAAISDFDEEVQAEVKAAVKASGEAVCNAAKQRVPVNRGKLKNSIKLYLLNKGMTALVAAGDTKDGYIGKFVEYGTGIYTTSDTAPHKPWTIRLRKAAYMIVAGGGLYLKEVTIRGQKPQPFLFPSWEEEKPRFIERITKAVKKAAGKVR